MGWMTRWQRRTGEHEVSSRGYDRNVRPHTRLLCSWSVDGYITSGTHGYYPLGPPNEDVSELSTRTNTYLLTLSPGRGCPVSEHQTAHRRRKLSARISQSELQQMHAGLQPNLLPSYAHRVLSSPAYNRSERRVLDIGCGNGDWRATQ